MLEAYKRQLDEKAVPPEDFDRARIVSHVYVSLNPQTVDHIA
jgi:hypothetical protein